MAISISELMGSRGVRRKVATSAKRGVLAESKGWKRGSFFTGLIFHYSDYRQYIPKFRFKVKLFADMDALTPPSSIIASSSSGIIPSVMQNECKHPERVLVGHPFNPPHIIPLVEVVGGTKTSPEAIEHAMVFYASIGKRPIHLLKEIPGHVGNRLQSALYREVMYLIEQGVLSVSDADDAVSWGPDFAGE